MYGALTKLEAFTATELQAFQVAELLTVKLACCVSLSSVRLV